MSRDFYLVQLSDEEVAAMIWDAALAGAPNGRMTNHRAVLARAVAAGRLIGAKQVLEPLDDGLRTVALAAFEELRGQGRVGLTENLLRLNRFLERYAARGRPDLATPPGSISDGDEHD